MRHIVLKVFFSSKILQFYENENKQLFTWLLCLADAKQQEVWKHLKGAEEVQMLWCCHRQSLKNLHIQLSL